MAESRGDYPSPDTARSEGTKGDLVVADVSTVAEFIGVKPKLEKPGLKKEELYSYQCSNDTPVQMQGSPFDHEDLKKLISNQNHLTKIRPVLLTLTGLPDSGKTKAIKHLLNHYVDESPLPPMSRKSYSRDHEAEGITYYELVAAGFHPLRDLTIAEVTNETSCAFGILSAFRKSIRVHKKVPLFLKESEVDSEPCFEDPDLEDHLQYIYKYLCRYERMPKGPNLSDNEKKIFAEPLCKLLPRGIALINIWDVSLNKTVLYVLRALFGQFYNSHTWLFLDIERDFDNLDQPPQVTETTTSGAHKDDAVLMKWRSRFQYLLRSSRMSESKYGPRKDVCTIFAKHSSLSNGSLAQKVAKIEEKAQQASKHVGVASLLESKIEPINLTENAMDDYNDYSHRLYQKFHHVICETPYTDVPLSWVFLRSMFYRDRHKMFILKSELKQKASECGIDNESFAKFCLFYSSFGSIFDFSLLNPECVHIIVRPIEFLRSLDKILHPNKSIFLDYPTTRFGLFPEKAYKSLFEGDWPIYMEALTSICSATKVSGACVKIPDLDRSDMFYYIPLSRNESLIKDADLTSVYLITSADTPHINSQVVFTKYILKSMSDAKLVPCSEINQTIIEVPSSNTTISLVCHGPANKIHISQPNPEVYSIVVQAYHNVFESCKTGSPKCKFVVVCTKSGAPDVKSIPCCQYHTLPNNKLCNDCEKAGRVNDQLEAWNKALSEHPIPERFIANEELTASNIHCIAEVFSRHPEIIFDFAEILGFQNYQNNSTFQGLCGEKLIMLMLLTWEQHIIKATQSQIEPRRELARKLLQLGDKVCKQELSLEPRAENNADQNQPLKYSDFEHLAKELDLYATSYERNVVQSKEDNDTYTLKIGDFTKPMK